MNVLSDIDRQALETCIAWAAQHDYFRAAEAALVLSGLTGREMVQDQPYYNNYVWQGRAETPSPE